MRLVARALMVVLCPCLCEGAAPSQQVYLKAANRRAWDAFATAVAVSGDIAVVGAPNENSGTQGVNGDSANANALGAGAAYVFVRENGVWRQQAYLKASNTGAHDGFGCSVAISGETIVVGALQEDSSSGGVNGNPNLNDAASAGAAYVFKRTAGIWTQQAYLKAAQPRAWNLFGVSVAISGESIVVGANRENSAASGVNGDPANTSASHAGAAYVFVRSGSTWAQQAYLKASDTAANAEFGSSVSLSGDTAVVGAPLAGGNTGAAYVFQRSGSSWAAPLRVVASNAAAGARFGFAVAVSGDSFAAGAPGEASNASGVNGNQVNLAAPEAGAVYVFDRSGNAWQQQAYLKASNSGAGDGFGDALALDGDRLVTGAYGEDSIASGVNGNGADNSADGAGAAYLFSRSAGAWQQDAYLKASNSEAGDWFGAAVAISGDLLFAGAERESGSGAGVYAVQNGNGAGSSGAAYGFAIPSAIPEIMVEQTGGPELADGAALAFASSAPGAMTMRTLTVKNTGSGPLVWNGCAFGGANAAQFSIDATDMPSAIAPGAQGILRVQFSAATAGSYAATVTISSNDADEGSFDLSLSANVAAAADLYAAWANASGLTGPAAAAAAIPKNDGVVNLLKFAFRLSGSAADTRNLDAGGGVAGLPVVKAIGSGAQAVFRLEYLRRKGSGLNYSPKVSSNLAPGSFTPMSGTTTLTDLDAQWERVRIEQPRGPALKNFAIVEATMP